MLQQKSEMFLLRIYFIGLRDSLIISNTLIFPAIECVYCSHLYNFIKRRYISHLAVQVSVAQPLSPVLAYIMMVSTGFLCHAYPLALQQISSGKSSFRAKFSKVHIWDVFLMRFYAMSSWRSPFDSDP